MAFALQRASMRVLGDPSTSGLKACGTGEAESLDLHTPDSAQPGSWSAAVTGGGQSGMQMPEHCAREDVWLSPGKESTCKPV